MYWQNFAILLSAAAFICAVVTVASCKWLKITEPVFFFDALPRGFDGFKLLHISDLHSRSAFKKNLDIWKNIDKLEFDIAVITGDLVLNSPEQINPHAESIKRLAAEKKVCYVDGNHEKHIYPKVYKKLKELGVDILDNKSTEIKKNGDSLTIYGFCDFLRLKPKPERYAEMIPEEGFKLVLQHQPQFFDYVKEKGELLMLCGHTHSGQLRFPFLPVIFAPGQGLFPKYGRESYFYKKAAMYISSGIGATVFPFRFYNRPEITIVTLRKR